MSINSPFRYAGGKFYARKLILKHIPDHNFYIEPFAGGGSIFFAKAKVSNSHLNDIDTDLINVYNVIKDTPLELISFLKRSDYNSSRIPIDLVSDVRIGDCLPAKKELHKFFKYDYIPLNIIEEAGRWYYLNRTSYSGIMNFQNMYWGYGDKYSMQPKNWPESILKTSQKLQSVNLTSLDFEEVIDKAQDNSFLFIDPPYYNADQDKFYTHSFTMDDHSRLERCLYRNRDRLLLFLTYDNNEIIRELYNWMPEFHDKEWNYCIQRTDDQRNKTDKKGERYKGKELFILNYNIEESLLQENNQLRLLA